jgi:hypothetical protein
VDVFTAVVGLLVTNKHYYAHHQELFQAAVAASGFRINAEVDVFTAVVGNTLSSVYVTKQYILRLNVASGWVFCLNI